MIHLVAVYKKYIVDDGNTIQKLIWLHSQLQTVAILNSTVVLFIRDSP